MFSFIKNKLLSSPNKKLLDKYRVELSKINALEPDIKNLSDIESFNSSGYMFSQNETNNPLEPVFVR